MRLSFHLPRVSRTNSYKRHTRRFEDCRGRWMRLAWPRACSIPPRRRQQFLESCGRDTRESFFIDSRTLTAARRKPGMTIGWTMPSRVPTAFSRTFPLCLQFRRDRIKSALGPSVPCNWDCNQASSSANPGVGVGSDGRIRVWSTCDTTANPFIDNLPPPPYPFGGVDLARAREGKALFKTACASCHTPQNKTIYSVTTLGVDPNRTLVNTSVSRYGLAALVMEACSIYGLNNAGKPGEMCTAECQLGRALDELPATHRTRRGRQPWIPAGICGDWRMRPTDKERCRRGTLSVVPRPRRSARHLTTTRAWSASRSDRPSALRT